MKEHVRSSSQYYLRYGLSRDPFPQEETDDVFYSTPELNHRLELVRHLLEFSEQLLIITAPKYGGKTTLAKKLIEKAESNWSINFIDGQDELDIDRLVQEILSDDTARLDHNLGPMDNLDKYLAYCVRTEKLPVLFIDDAHRLSIDVLRFIIQLACIADREQRWRIVLLSDNSLDMQLEDPQIRSLNTGLIHNIDVLPLTLEQTEAFIRYRLSRSGTFNKEDFSERELKQIHKVSAGLPGKINQLARQSLIDPALDNTAGENWGLSFAYLQRKPFIMTSLLLVGLFAWVYTNDSGHTDNIQQDKIALPPENTTRIEKSVEEDLLTLPETKEPQSVVATNDDPVLEPVSEIEEDGKQALPDIEQAKEAITEAIIEEQVNEEEINSEEKINEEPAGEPVNVAQEESVPAGPLADLKGMAWIRAQRPESYVLQLIGAVEMETITDFVDANNIPADSLSWFTTKQAGKDWHVLVYGLYPNRDRARADISSLPDNLKNLHPWPRSIADIQTAIK